LTTLEGLDGLDEIDEIESPSTRFTSSPQLGSTDSLPNLGMNVCCLFAVKPNTYTRSPKFLETVMFKKKQAAFF